MASVRGAAADSQEADNRAAAIRAGDTLAVVHPAAVDRVGDQLMVVVDPVDVAQVAAHRAALCRAAVFQVDFQVDEHPAVWSQVVLFPAAAPDGHRLLVVALEASGLVAVPVRSPEQAELWADFAGSHRPHRPRDEVRLTAGPD